MRIGSLDARGVSIFEVGSAGAPSITFSGSTTAGFFAPSAGQVAISAGSGVNVFEVEGGGTPGKITLTTGYDSLIPAGGAVGDDNAVVSKKWVEDNFTLGSGGSIGLNDLDDVTITGAANNDFLVNNGVGQFVNQVPATARTSLGVAIGSDVQAWSTNLDDIAGLTPTADNFIVGDGGNWTQETPAEARTSLGLVAGGAGDIWVEKAGDSMDSGANLTFSGNGEVLGLPATPSGSTAAASRAYVDAAVTGLNWLDPVFYIDLIDDSFCVNVTKDLQNQSNDTDLQITSVQDSDMLVVGNGAIAQGLTWTAVGVTGNTANTTGLMPGDIMRWNSDSENGFVDPVWEKVQEDEGGPNISVLVFQDETVSGLHASESRWGSSIVTDATLGGSFFGFENNIWDLVSDDANDDGDTIVLTNSAVGAVTASADGGTGYSITQTQAGSGSLPEITTVVPTGGASGLATAGSADYWTFDTVGANNYYVWYSVNGGTMVDPTPGGTGIQVDVYSTDGEYAVANKTSGAIAAIVGAENGTGEAFLDANYDAWWGISEAFGVQESNTVTVETQANINDSDFFYLTSTVQAPFQTATLTITNTANGAAADTVDGSTPTNFRFTKLVDGSAGTAEQTEILFNGARSFPDSGTGPFFDFTDHTATTYRVWFDKDNGNTAPGVTTEVLIEVDIGANFCASSTSLAAKAAINGSAANTTATTTADRVFGDDSADGGLRFHVWFDKSGTAVDPAPIDSYEGIEVDISGATTQNDVALAIQTVLDAHRPQLTGAAIGESTLWTTSVSTTDITITNTHSGRGTAPFAGTGTSGGAWVYSVGGRTQGTYVGPSNNDAFYVSNPDSFNAGNQYVFSSSSDSWIQFGGSTTILPGIGLSQSGQFFNVNLGPGIYENPSDQVSIEFWTTTTGALILTSDGTTRDFNNVNAKLQLIIDGSTLTQGASGLKVPTQGITETELNLTVAGDGISGGNGTPLAVDGGDGITLSGGQAIVDATSTFTFPGGQLEIQASAVTDSMLATDYVEVAGDTMTGDLTMGSGAQIFLAGDGTATDPGLSVAGDTDTGVYSVGTNQLGVSAGGTLRATFNTTDLSLTVPLLVQDGTAGSPSISNLGDTDTGMYFPADNAIGLSSGSSIRFLLESTGLMSTGGTSAAAYESLVIAASGTAIPNKEYVDNTVGALSSTRIIDADADTKVDTEESADDDTVRIDVGDTPAGYGAVADIFVLNSSAWTVGMGNANTAATVGAPITLTAGQGNGTGNGGVVNVTAGQGGSSGIGGAITVGGGAGGVTTGAGGNATLQGGNATGTGGGGDANVYAGTGLSVGGSVNVAAGLSSGSDTGGTVSIQSGQGGPTGTGGTMFITAGAAGATSGDGGYTLIYGGSASGPTGTGGYAALYGGSGYYGGEAKVTAGSGSGGGYGGAAILQSGAGAAGAGNVQIIGAASTSGDGGTVSISGGNGNSASSNGGNIDLSAGNATSNIGGNVTIATGNGSSDANDGIITTLSQYIEMIPKSTSTGASFRMREGTSNGTEYIGHKAPDAITSTITYTWPEAPAANGYALVSTTAGILSWIDIAASLDNSRITDGDSTTAETYIDTNESANTINSQVGQSATVSAFQPFFASNTQGNVAIEAGNAAGASYGPAGFVLINAGAGTVNADGGGIDLTGGNGGSGSNDGGRVLLTAGDASGSGSGGYIDITGGTAYGSTTPGHVRIKSGFTNTMLNGSQPQLEMGFTTQSEVTLRSGSGSTGTTPGGALTLTSGDGSTSGAAGDLTLQAGSSASGTAGNVSINTGNGAAPGYVELSTTNTADSVALRFDEASVNGTDWIALKAPTGVSTSRTWVLPQTAPVLDNVLRTDGSGNLSFTSLASLASTEISLGDLSDVIDTVPQTNQVVSVLVGDGTNKETQTLVDGTNITAVVDQGADTVTLNVDDSFIANQAGDSFGDTSSGVWTIVSGSRLDAATGASIRMADAPTVATDLTNKSYVDSISAGLDPKESCLVASTEDFTGVTWGSPSYNYTAGSGGTGAFVDINLSPAVDGVSLAVNDRVLVKDQANARQNGIYVVKTGTSFPTQALLERAEDHDGTPADEVSGGNFTFIEGGNTYADTGWVLTGVGTLSLSTNGADGDSLNWTQFTGAGSFNAGLGLSQAGNTLDIDVDDLAVATIVSTDSIAFHDGDGTPATSGSITRKTTAANFIADLGLLTTSGTGGAIGGTDGVLFNTTTNNMELDITNLADTAINSADEMVFDNGASGLHVKRTVGSFLNDLDVVNLGTFTSAGILSRTADDTYAEVVLTPATTGLEGIDIQNGNGSGTPTIGLDINTLTAGGTPGSTERFVVFDGTNNVTASVSDVTAAVVSATNIGDLADVTADSTTDPDGNVLVMTGTNYVTKKIQHNQTVTAQTTAVINHNIGQQYVTVQCYNSSNVMVLPASVTLTNSNTTTVTFSPAFTGTVVIMGIPGVPVTA